MTKQKKQQQKKPRRVKGQPPPKNRASMTDEQKVQYKVDGYVLDESLDLCSRVAQFLNWAANKYPEVLYTYSVVWLVTSDLGEFCTEKSAEIKILKTKLKTIRTRLAAYPHPDGSKGLMRGLVVDREGSIRATSTEADYTKVRTVPLSRRTAAGNNTLHTVLAQTDTSTFPKDAAGKELARYVKTNLPISRQVASLTNKNRHLQIISSKTQEMFLPAHTGDKEGA